LALCGVAIGARTNGAPNGERDEEAGILLDGAPLSAIGQGTARGAPLVQAQWRRRTITTTASPKSVCACPGGWASGTNIFRPRSSRSRIVGLALGPVAGGGLHP
jgi:hypothetical protein